jgi:hypothetical protein
MFRRQTAESLLVGGNGFPIREVGRQTEVQSELE